jgi:hypothetical protein
LNLFNDAHQPANAQGTAVAFAKGLAGSLLGAVLGYFVFDFALGNGLYMMVAPGALVGLGCGYLSGVRSLPIGVLAAVIALVFSLFLEWHFLPFRADRSLSFFLQNIADVNKMDLIMIGVSTLFGFWFGRGR